MMRAVRPATDTSARIAATSPAPTAGPWIADTIGCAVPTQTEDLVAAVVEATGLPVRVHLHNSRNTGFANAVGALRGGGAFVEATFWDQMTLPDTTHNPLIHHVRHAVSIDERRSCFRPIQCGLVDTQDLKEVWFAGVHSNVGGGYPRQGMSLVALDWMMARAEPHGLRFVEDAIVESALIEKLRVAAEATTALGLATGVIPLDRRPVATLDLAGLPAERTVLGIGSGGARHPLADHRAQRLSNSKPAGLERKRSRISKSRCVRGLLAADGRAAEGQAERKAGIHE